MKDTAKTYSSVIYLALNSQLLVLDQLSTQANSLVRNMSQEALQQLMRHPLSGNVRQLHNIVEYALVLCRSDPSTLWRKMKKSVFTSPSRTTQRHGSLAVARRRRFLPAIVAVHAAGV